MKNKTGKNRKYTCQSESSLYCKMTQKRKEKKICGNVLLGRYFLMKINIYIKSAMTFQSGRRLGETQQEGKRLFCPELGLLCSTGTRAPRRGSERLTVFPCQLAVSRCNSPGWLVHELWLGVRGSSIWMEKTSISSSLEEEACRQRNRKTLQSVLDSRRIHFSITARSTSREVAACSFSCSLVVALLLLNVGGATWSLTLIVTLITLCHLTPLSYL